MERVRTVSTLLPAYNCKAFFFINIDQDLNEDSVDGVMKFREFSGSARELGTSVGGVGGSQFNIRAGIVISSLISILDAITRMLFSFQQWNQSMH